MTVTKACPECGARVPTDAPFGLCPRCLMNASTQETGTYRPIEKKEVAATPTPTVEWPEILRILRELELAPPEEIDRLASVSGEDPAQLARALVQTGKLTPYQSKALLQGKARGLLIGQYLVEDKLGAGGMGVVFKARHRPSGRVVALKILPPSFGREPETVRRFRREFQIASRLSHPNLVAAIEASEDRGVHYLTMEYIPGYDLDRLVSQGGPMALKLALHCAIQVARGLEAAHAQGVIHRDIKPGNVMIDPAGAVRVLDLGLARVIEATSGFGQTAMGTLTQSGAYMGTVDFLAPEQANDAKSADPRADIYSLGCTLYFLLTGRPPFTGETVLKRLMAHQDRPAPSLRAARPEVSEALEETYLKMMAKRPADRPQSMSAVVIALEACRTSAREAGDVSVDLKTFARTALKRAPIRGRRGPDASVLARYTPEPGLSFDPDLRLEDLVGDYRDELGHDEIPEEKLPPIVSRPMPKRPRRSRNSPPYAQIGLALLGLAALVYVFRSQGKSVVPEPARPPSVAVVPPPTADVDRASIPPIRLASDRLQPGGPAMPVAAFQALFNGRDLAGWAGAVGDYEVRDGLLAIKPGRKAVIYDPVERTDFAARVEFRLMPGSESGLLIHYPGESAGPNFISVSLCEVQVLDDSHPTYAGVDDRIRCGSAWGQVAARRGIVKPPGEWNVQEVTVRGSKVRVELNGVPVLDADCSRFPTLHDGQPHPGKDRALGFFGIQGGTGTNQGSVQYRTIEIRDLSLP